ncbi:T9SS type A sorting domain-containing protein [Bacteroidota bacterium]
MKRKLKISMILCAGVWLGLLGLLQKDCHPLPGRESHEKFLTSLYLNLPKHNTGTVLPDGPEYAGFRDYIMTMDPETRQVPQKAWLKAARRVETENYSGKLKSGYMFEWEEIPSDIGGRTRALMYDPNDPHYNKIWAGAVTGGLWYRDNIRSRDGWLPVNDFWPSLAISCITYDPSNTQTFYVGTGEGQTAVVIYRESSGRGSGIWKSSDGGTNWELLPSTEEFEYVTDIAVRNESGKSVIYAGVTSGIYKGEIHSSKPADGLYRSEDGGDTWVQVLPDIPGTGIPYAPAHIEISAGGRIFIGTMRNVYQEGGGRIIYSDNGVDWFVIDDFVTMIARGRTYNIPGRVILACAPSDEKRVYAIIAGGIADSRSGFIYSRGMMIVRSEDSGLSWKRVNMPTPPPDSDIGQWSFLAWHCLTAAVQPDNPDVLWIGGQDLFRSDDGGLTWGQKSLWWNHGRYYQAENLFYVHADHHSLIYRPGSLNELLNSNDGGVFISYDATEIYPWFQEINKGYNTLQYYTCAIHPVAGQKYYLGGCQDNGTFRTTDQPTSIDVSVSGGDGTYCFIDEDEPEIQISGSQFNYYYYSSDGNHNAIHYYNFQGGTFINPVDYDHIKNTLYANGMTFEGHYRDTIFRIPLINDTLLTAEVVPANTGSQVPFSAIHVLPWKEQGNTVVFAGSHSGRLYRLNKAQSGISATEIGSQDFPAGYISCIQTGSTAEQILITFSNYGVKHVWETKDGGNTWKDKTGNLPDIPVRWAIYPPGLPGSVMLATELGIWYTLEIGSDSVIWQKEESGFPMVRVDMLRSRKSDNHILAATHGRGLYLSSGPIEVKTPVYHSPEGEIRIFPNPAGEHISVEIRSGRTGDLNLGIYSLNGQLIRQENIHKPGQEITYQLQLQGLAAGSYILRVGAGDEYLSKTFIKKK